MLDLTRPGPDEVLVRNVALSVEPYHVGANDRLSGLREDQPAETVPGCAAR